MTTLKALWPVVNQFQNKNGSILTGGKIYIYYQGRTALATTYHDEDGKVINSNPILLDNNGRATVFADTAYSYTIVVCDYYGKELFSQDITLHDVTETADEITLIGSDGSIHIDTSSSNGVKTFDMSANTDILATKKSVDNVKTDLTNLTGTVNNHTTQIEGIESTVANKKDKQNELNFNGSATKTIKKITQNVNGELNVEFADIDLPSQVPNVEITSEDNSVKVTETTDVQTNTKTFDLSVDDKIPDPSTSNPLMDGTASVGSSIKYAREDHVHPSDTSKESVSNKTSVVIGTSNSKYPTEKAVADFVNSSVATNTANYISNNGEPFTSVEELEAYTGTVTNNDYAFVTGTDSAGNTYYDRYKATVSGSTVTWALEYRLNNSSFTAAQWAAINSGITSALVAKIHDHSNKDVLDGITSTDVANWNSKQNSLTAGNNITIDGNTISSNQLFVAKYGTTKYAEIKAAYNAGKICTVFRNGRYYYVTWVNSDYIQFSASNENDRLYQVSVTSANKWSAYSIQLQSKLTFDTTPTAGSNNPVTSDGIKTAINAKANVQADWNITNSSSGAFIKNKPYYTKYTTTSTYYKVCSFPVTSSDSVDISGIQILARYFLGGVNGRLIYKNEFRLYYERVSEVYFNNHFVKFYYVTNGSKIDLYAQRNGYPTLHVAPLVNQPKSRVDFTDFGTDVSSLPEGATEIKPVWVANSVRSSGTAPVKVNEFGDLTPVPMDSTPTANSTNLMTSGAIKTALDSRIPAPTSTTGTQVLKCINGVIQWVNE